MNVGFAAVMGILVLIIIWGVVSYNGFVREETSVDEAFSTMDVYLKKRFDLVPNLVEVVKGYAAHESETLLAVVDARNAVAHASSPSDRMTGETELGQTLQALHITAEAYPELKANTNYQELMQQLESVENDIANARKYYNGCVKKFNIRVRSFPSNLIGRIFQLEPKPLFEVRSEVERDKPQVKF